MKLYYNPLSTYSQKVMLALNEKGLGYELSLVDLSSATARETFERINPLGKVPFLESDAGWRAPESTSIIEYLEQAFPDAPRLIPADGAAARRVRFVDRMADLYFNDPVVELLFQRIGMRGQDAERAERARKYIAASYANWEQMLGEQEWMCGADVTMADCAAIPPFYLAELVAPFQHFANITAYWRRAQARPSYAKIRATLEPIWKGVVAGAP